MVEIITHITMTTIHACSYIHSNINIRITRHLYTERHKSLADMWFPEYGGFYSAYGKEVENVTRIKELLNVASSNKMHSCLVEAQESRVRIKRNEIVTPISMDFVYQNQNSCPTDKGWHKG